MTSGDSQQRRIEKVRNPSLVFVAELPRPGDAGHAEHHRTQSVNAGVIVNILVGRALGATVGRVKIQRLRLGSASRALRRHVAFSFHSGQPVGKASVNLVGGSKQQGRIIAGKAGGFEDVEGSADVDFEVEPRVGDGGGDRNLRCKVIDFSSMLDRTLNFDLIPNVAYRELEASRASGELLQPFEVVARTWACEVIVNVDFGFRGFK